MTLGAQLLYAKANAEELARETKEAQERQGLIALRERVQRHLYDRARAKDYSTPLSFDVKASEHIRDRFGVPAWNRHHHAHDEWRRFEAWARREDLKLTPEVKEYGPDVVHVTPIPPRPPLLRRMWDAADRFLWALISD